MKIAPFHTLAKRFPEIAREWHPTKNKQLTPDQVTPFSGKKVWWQCRKEAEHEWETQVSSRTSVKAKCPFCSGRKVSSTNSLKARFPELAREWHPTKNEKLKPQHVTPTSDKKVWWLCKTNRQHEWRAAIGQRYRGSGCPYCVNRRVNGSNSLVLSFPELVKEWHPKNGKLIPENVSPGTAKRVWWHCTKDKSHEWESPVNSRTLKKSGCPFCTSQRVSPTNSLKAVFPELSEQWHPARNGSLTPADVTKMSNKRVWWLCSKNASHEWEACIKDRAGRGYGCPLCYREAPRKRR